MNGTKAMKLKFDRAKCWANRCYSVFAIFFIGVQISLGQTGSPAPPQGQAPVMTTTTTEQQPAANLPPEQLDSLVAPIALYSDPLLATTLAASTYPLEIIQLQQWMDKNKNLKDKTLADALAKQPWDPSVQSLAATPDVVQRLAGNIQWTTDLGNAFLAQQSDVMAAVQRMRGKAQGTGNLQTSAQQKVETQTVEGGRQVITIEPAQPDVVYVPSYDPTVVYGAPPPAYPYYPYTYPGYYPGMGLAWGAAGFALGAWAGGAWGDCDWHGGGDININNKNNFNRNVNRNTNRNVNRGAGAGQGNRWQHNPSHRGNAPYGDRGTADKFGGRGPGQGGNRPGAGGTRPGGGGAGIADNRPGAGAGNRPGAGAGNRPSTKPGGGASTRPGGGNRPGGGASTRPSTKPAGGNRGSNSVGNRSVSSGGSKSAFSGSGGGRNSGNYARASSSRGGSSMKGGGYSRGGGSYGGSRGGGFSGGGRGGGGRGGGGRGGGGGRR